MYAVSVMQSQNLQMIIGNFMDCCISLFSQAWVHIADICTSSFSLVFHAFMLTHMLPCVFACILRKQTCLHIHPCIHGYVHVCAHARACTHTHTRQTYTRFILLTFYFLKIKNAHTHMHTCNPPPCTHTHTHTHTNKTDIPKIIFLTNFF